MEVADGNQPIVSSIAAQKGPDEVSAAIKTYLVTEVIRRYRQPSPGELVAELDRKIGEVARWDLVFVLKSLAKNRAVTAAKRDHVSRYE